MASLNRSESEQDMKLIANFGIAGVLKNKRSSNFWRTLCCFAVDSEDEVIEMNVPVQNLNRRFHIVVKCRNTKMNVRLQPQNGERRFVDLRRVNELLAPIRSSQDCGDVRNSSSTVFSTPFPDFAPDIVNFCGNSRSWAVNAASIRKRTSSV